MKFFFLDKILKLLGRKLDGYKTVIGAIGIILTGLPPVVYGVLGLLGQMFPDQNLPQLEPEQALEQLKLGGGIISGGFVALGLGGKAEKLKRAVEAQTPIPATLETAEPSPAPDWLER